MTVYWITTLLSYLFAKLYDWLKGKRLHKLLESRAVERLAMLFSLAVLVVVTGFRWQVGADYPAYERYFYHVAYGFGQGRFEIGYYLLNVACSLISDHPRLLFLACSVIFFSFAYAAICRMSTDCSLSIFLLIGCGYFFYFMNGMRQMVAAAIVLFAISVLYNGRTLRFVLIILLASSFHASALLCLCALVFRVLPISKVSIVGIIICCVAFTVSADTLAYLAACLFGYSDYLVNDAWQANTGIAQILINACILIFGVVMYYHEGKVDEVLKLCILMQIVALLLAVTTGQVPLIQRVQQFFGIQQIVLIPRSLDAIREKRLRWLVRCSIIIVYIVYIYITVGLWNSNTVLPYQWSV